MRLIRVVVAAGLLMLAACSTSAPGEFEGKTRSTAVDVSGIILLVNHSADDTHLFEGAFCGGILLDPAVILTAAHCVDEREASTIDAISGAEDLCAGGYESRIRVESVRNVIGTGGSLVLLRAASAFARAPATVSSSPPADGDQLLALGWGRTSIGGVPSCTLRSIGLSAVDPTRCTSAGASVEPSRIICSIPSAEDNSCDGDSGGPVLMISEDELTVVGVTISGFGCAADSLGVNALVTQPLVAEWLAEAP